MPLHHAPAVSNLDPSQPADDLIGATEAPEGRAGTIVILSIAKNLFR
jgi:hypothetical protein